jgi:hypothetical protein
MTPSPNRRVRSALVAVALTAGSIGTAVAVAGPAAAVSNDCQTTSTLTINGSTADQAVQFGSTVTLAASVALGTCAMPDPPPSVEAGTLTIDRSLDDGATWSTLATVQVTPETSTVSVSGTRLVNQISLYRAAYTGTTSPEPTVDTFHSSVDYSWAGPYRTHKRLASSHWVSGGYVADYQLRPVASIAGLRVRFERREGGTWKVVGSAKVNEHGVFSHKFTPGLTRIHTPRARGFIDDEWGLKVIIRHGRTTLRTVR